MYIVLLYINNKLYKYVHIRIATPSETLYLDPILWRLKIYILWRPIIYI